VQQAEESERQLIDRAKLADSDAAWTVGECASLWTQKYAKGRTDEAFARMTGLSAQVVQQRRRVHELFADVSHTYAKLCWSHFYAACAWPDAPECLQWAEDNGANVAEMKAWRRMQRGEDITVEPDDDECDSGVTSDEEEEQAFVEDAAEPEHVADVDPYQRPPSIVKPTPRETGHEPGGKAKASSQPVASDYDANEPAQSKRSQAQSSAPISTKSVEERHFTLAELRHLLRAAEDTAGDVRESKALAAWHRERADELDPPRNQA